MLEKIYFFVEKKISIKNFGKLEKADRVLNEVSS